MAVDRPRNIGTTFWMVMVPVAESEPALYMESEIFPAIPVVLGLTILRMTDWLVMV